MPPRGYKAIGVTLREDEYVLLNNKLRAYGFEDLSDMVKAIIKDDVRIISRKNVRTSGFYSKLRKLLTS
jgi:hypothetical protein